MEARMMNEYAFNAKFREYVDKYCKKHQITKEIAMSHSLIKQIYLHFTEV